MANCDSGNQTLDPFQSILDSVSKGVTTLENQALLILPYVEQFRTFAESVVPSTPTDFNDALDKFTADAICANSTNLAPINDMTTACFNEAAKAIKKFLNDILDVIGDGIDLILELALLPENIIMNLMQKIKALTNTINALIQGLNIKIQCVSVSEQAEDYSWQVDILFDRVTKVTDDLCLDDDGNFSLDALMDGIANPEINQLKNNMISFNEKTESLKTEITYNISSTVDLTAPVNPKNYF